MGRDAIPAGDIHLGKNRRRQTKDQGRRVPSRKPKKKFGRVRYPDQSRRRFSGGFQDRRPKPPWAEWQAMFRYQPSSRLFCAAARSSQLCKRTNTAEIRVGQLAYRPSTGAGEFCRLCDHQGPLIKTFTASLAEEVLGDNVLVNAIAPSTIDTEANRKAMPKAQTRELG